MKTFAHKPVTRYRKPAYPREGYEIPHESRTAFWARMPSKKIVAAVLSGVVPLSAGCDLFEPEISGGMRAPNSYLSEADAQVVLYEALMEKGIEVAEHEDFTLGEVTFSADGWHQGKQVGFEYVSEGETELNPAELMQIEEWKSEDGPYFLILHDFNYPLYDDENWEAQMDHLRSDVQEFITFLENQGII